MSTGRPLPHSGRTRTGSAALAVVRADDAQQRRRVRRRRVGTERGRRRLHQFAHAVKHDGSSALDRLAQLPDDVTTAATVVHHGGRERQVPQLGVDLGAALPTMSLKSMSKAGARSLRQSQCSAAWRRLSSGLMQQ